MAGWLGKALGGLAGGAVGLLTGGPGGAIKGAAAGAGLIGGAEAGGKADKQTALQLALQKQRYDAGQPFRDKLPGLAASLPTQRENLDSIFADKANPYARTIARPIASAFPPPDQRGFAGGVLRNLPQPSEGGSPFLTQPKPIPRGMQNAMPGGLLQKILAKQQGNTATPRAPVPGSRAPMLPGLLARIRAQQGGFR